MDDASSSTPAESNTAEPAVPREGEFLRQFLAGRDVPCPMCEYNLRDLEGDRCPECGDQLTLEVNPVEPKQAAVITGLVLLAAGAGFNGLFLVWVAAFVLSKGGRGAVPAQIFYLNIGGFLIEALAIGVWVKQWKRIRRLPTFSRWALSICFCGFLTIADLAVFIKYVR
jgi:hypothetical protein